MTLLSDLIRKRRPEAVATATLATSATLEGENKRNVAKVATVTVADAQTDEIAEPAGDTRQTLRQSKAGPVKASTRYPFPTRTAEETLAILEQQYRDASRGK